MAAAALALHIAGMIEDGESIPEPSTLDALAEDPAIKHAVAFLVDVEPEAERTVRIDITARAKQVESIDQMAGEAGMTRPAYMVQSVLSRLPRQPRPALPRLSCDPRRGRPVGQHDRPEACPTPERPFPKPDTFTFPNARC
jgi:hypothetical protein